MYWIELRDRGAQLVFPPAKTPRPEQYDEGHDEQHDERVDAKPHPWSNGFGERILDSDSQASSQASYEIVGSLYGGRLARI